MWIWEVDGMGNGLGIRMAHATFVIDMSGAPDTMLRRLTGGN